MGWESHHSRSTHPRHLGQHSANLSPATPMCLLSSPDSDLFLSAQGAGFNRPYTLNNYPHCWRTWDHVQKWAADLPAVQTIINAANARTYLALKKWGDVDPLYRVMVERYPNPDTK